MVKENTIRQAFRLSLVIKASFAALEILAGVFSMFVTQDRLLRLMLYVTQNERAEDASDRLSHALIQYAQQFSINQQHFIILYLLTHGLLKLLLILGLLKKKLWCYPLAIAIFALFIDYQMGRYAVTHSLWLLIMTALDVIVIGLTWYEWNYLKKQEARRAD